jgi:hypothetical protein
VVQTLQWSGYLNTYGEAPITFASESLSNEGILKTTITSINNGTGDEDFSNNVRNDQFTLAPQFNTTQVLLKIRTDNYGEETYWEVRDDAGVMLENGGNHDVGPLGGGAFPLGTPIGPGSYPSLSIIRDTLELPATGCYSIHFSDAYGDGMCCDFGTGYYKLYDLDNPGVPLITGGEFEDYSRRAFGAGVLSATSDPEQSLNLELYPNPASEILNIEIEAAAGADISAKVFNTLGQLQHSFPLEKANQGGNHWQIPLGGWPKGVYFLQLRLNEKLTTKTFLVGRN